MPRRRRPEVVVRRHQLIAQHLGFLLPDENRTGGPAATDEEYAAAIAALRERTRDTSRVPLVMAENIACGFWRNTCSCRVPAVVVCALAAIAALVLGALAPASLSWPQRAGMLLFDAAPPSPGSCYAGRSACAARPRPTEASCWLHSRRCVSPR